MFITRECDYAVRVVRALWGESRLSVSDICEKEAITAPFAYKIRLIQICLSSNVWIRNITVSETDRMDCHVWYIENCYLYRMN